MVLLGQDLGSTNTPVHELGHFFSLCHTDGCEHNSGDDEVDDTLTDRDNWDTADKLAQKNFEKDYAALTDPKQIQQVDVLLVNVMAHRPGRLLFSSDQLDRMTDDSNDRHNWVASGRTRFVDSSGAQILAGTSQFPVSTVDLGIGLAISGDIVLVRAGTYIEPMTISKSVFLRASRGSAIIRGKNH